MCASVSQSVSAAALFVPCCCVLCLNGVFAINRGNRTCHILPAYACQCLVVVVAAGTEYNQKLLVLLWHGLHTCTAENVPSVLLLMLMLQLQSCVPSPKVMCVCEREKRFDDEMESVLYFSTSRRSTAMHAVQCSAQRYSE